MIYVSTSCIKTQGILDDIMTLMNAGFGNIELSGGAKYEEDVVDRLIALKEAHGLNFLCHNYFPQPREPFVINLASLDNDIYSKSLDFLRSAVETSRSLGASKYGFHAGFFFDIPVSEIGNKISARPLFDKKKSLARFLEGYKRIKNNAGDIEIYLENNVISMENYIAFNKVNAFMLTNDKEYFDLRKELDLKLLLDIGHLKVSSNTLGIDFKEEMSKLLPVSDYIHLSDNDSLFDQNSDIKKDGDLFRLLKHFDLRDKIITLEIKNNVDKLKQNYHVVEGLLNG